MSVLELFGLTDSTETTNNFDYPKGDQWWLKEESEKADSEEEPLARKLPVTFFQGYDMYDFNWYVYIVGEDGKRQYFSTEPEIDDGDLVLKFEQPSVATTCNLDHLSDHVCEPCKLDHQDVREKEENKPPTPCMKEHVIYPFQFSDERGNYYRIDSYRGKMNVWNGVAYVPIASNKQHIYS